MQAQKDTRFYTKDGEQFRKAVMRRVYAVWFLRTLFRPTLVRLYILTALVAQISVQVSLANVFVNAPGMTNFTKNLIFFGRAFTNTEVVVQVLVLGIAGLFFFICIDAIRGKNFNLFPRRAF